MNKKDTVLLLKEVKKNTPNGTKIQQIAESRAVLEGIDVVKTRVWGLLSKDYKTTKDIREILAFIDFIANKLTFTDLEKEFALIEKKLNGLFHQTDGNTLENLIVETFNKNIQDKTKITVNKCPQEIDELHKSDMVTSYFYKGVKYKIGAQITTIDGEGLLRLKNLKIQNAIGELDKSKEEWKFKKKFELDSIMLIQLNGIFTTYLGRGKNILQKSLSEWQNNGYKGDLIEYIENLDFSIELLRFCELYPFIIGNYFKTVNFDINKIGFTDKTIISPTGEKIKVHFIRNEGKIEFDVYDGDNFLFKIVFYVNDKLLQKMYQNGQDN